MQYGTVANYEFWFRPVEGQPSDCSVDQNAGWAASNSSDGSGSDRIFKYLLHIYLTYVISLCHLFQFSLIKLQHCW